MADSAFSWLVLAVAAWGFVGFMVVCAINKPSAKRTESDKVTSIYPYL